MNSTRQTCRTIVSRHIAGGLALLAISLLATTGCSSSHGSYTPSGYSSTSGGSDSALAAETVIDSTQRMQANDNEMRQHEEDMTSLSKQVDGANQEAYDFSSFTMTPTDHNP